MKFKRIGVIFFVVLMCMGMFPATAFAYVEEEPEPTEETVIEEPAEETEGTAEEGDPPLTPDGNMNLVDDIGSATGAGKQFITLTTQNGNYFYLIIDRDDKGNENVHFLNLVDEADLLSLMEEDAVKEYWDSHTEPEPIEPEITPEPEVVEPEPVEQKKPNVLPSLILIVVLVAGGGFFAFQKLKGKKGRKQEKPDPDADYVDDEEDYGYVEVNEDMEDEEIFNNDEDNEPV